MNSDREETREAQVLLARGRFWLQRQDHEAALTDLIACHRRGFRKDEVESLVLEHIYAPRQEEYRRNYLKNTALLMTYPYIGRRDFPDFNELTYLFIPFSALRFIIFDRRQKAFIGEYDLKSNLDLNDSQENQVFLIQNECRLGNIIAYEEKSRDPQPFLWAKTPQYLVYEDFNEFVQYLQLLDLSPALETERLVFFFGRKEMEDYFSEPQAVMPGLLLNTEDYVSFNSLDFIQQKYYSIQKAVADLQSEIDDYYAQMPWGKQMERINHGKPRILFTTSRFTTALQYYIRDCARACEQLNIPCQVLIEKSDIHRITMLAWLKVLYDFKPDIVFSIDHFRWESPFLPENIVFLTWVQDLLPQICSRESSSRLGRRDLILNAFFSNNSYLLDLNYPGHTIIEAPVPASPHIYKHRNLRQEEKELYGTDICAFSNTGNPRQGLDEFLMLLSSSPYYSLLKKTFQSAYREMYQSFYRENTFYSLEDYISFISRHLQSAGLSINKQSLHDMAQAWRQEVGYRILKSVPLEWLHEKRYSMKLWGSEWSGHPILASYARGVAPNGETLSRIIKAGKIVIGTNPGSSSHPRVYETILSNTFYLAYRIPEEHDWANIRRYLDEGREIVFASDREDLYKKIDFYLDHEKERRKIIQKARKKIMKNLTYEALINRIVKETARILEANFPG